MGMIDEQFKNSELKVLRQALHAALQREGFAVKERDEAREVFQTAMELSKKYKDERISSVVVVDIFKSFPSTSSS